MAARVSELIEEWIDGIEADSTVNGEISSRAYQSYPENDAAFPMVTVEQIGDQPAGGEGELGIAIKKNEVVFQVSVWATSKTAARTICDAIDDVHYATRLTTTNWFCPYQKRGPWREIKAPYRDPSTGAQIWQFTSDWTLITFART